MEFTLESAAGVPAGAVLSIKIGDTKRQSPVAKLGQPFRFASSPAEPLPMMVEVLAPVAPMQSLRVDPSKPAVVVDFGDEIKVTLAQRQAPELQRPAADVQDAAASRGFALEKLQTAQCAANYLEQHDLVRTFQDILHSLLVDKPVDPISYIEEYLSRARALCVKKEAVTTAEEADLNERARGALEAALGDDIDEAPPDAEADLNERARGALEAALGDDIDEAPPDAEADLNERARGALEAALGDDIDEAPLDAAIPDPKPKKSNKRGSILNTPKVDSLLDALHRANRNLPLVTPLLPEDLREFLLSEHLQEECISQFNQLAQGRGRLGHQELIPVMLHLCSLGSEKAYAVQEDQAGNFMKLFDQDGDGSICCEEFASLVQFVIIAAHLETPEGKKLLNIAQVEDARFKECLQILETDRDRLNDIVPMLPEWLVAQLMCDDFLNDCDDRFDALDKDGKEYLKPADLMPVVLSLTNVDPKTMNSQKLERFARIFDVDNTGVITREQFIDFTQFMAVMNFLDSSQATALSTDQQSLKAYMAMLKQDWTCLSQVYAILPRTLLHDLQSNAFATSCISTFEYVDSEARGSLEPQKLVPLLQQLCAEHPIAMDEAILLDIFGYFDNERRGAVRGDQVVEFAKFAVVLAYLDSCREWHDNKPSKRRIARLLDFLKVHTDQFDNLLPYFPRELQEKVLSPEFERNCIADFSSLDKSQRGWLEPKELTPVILRLSQGHHMEFTESQVDEFVSLFAKKRGVITQSEFTGLSVFMVIVAHLKQEEHLIDDGEVMQGVQLVDDLLDMMAKDRQAIHKIIPLLPADVFDDITNDSFITQCQERFKELDKDGNGTLEPEELFPVIVELSCAHPFAIDVEHCQQFTAIFDAAGDGVIRAEEFVDFARFLCIMNYLHSAEGSERMADGLEIMESSKKIDELLITLRKDRNDMRKVIPYLPDQLCVDLLSDRFTSTCIEKFKALDKDGNGTLEPLELFPLILDMSKAHDYALDLEQCQQFSDIFDDAKTGVITENQFVNFARFIMVMNFLRTEDGERTLALATAEQPLEVAPLQVQPQQMTDNTLASMQSEGIIDIPSEMSHMAVDIEFYLSKAEKLELENEGLRTQVLRLEDAARSRQSLLERADQQLRHAEIDLRECGRNLR